MGELNKHPARFKELLDRNQVIVICCKCEIWYSGRAESYLPIGDRIILIKEDNSLIVHQPTGNAPVNYMKPESKHTLVFTDNHLFLNSRNLYLKEYMDIKIAQVHFFNSAKIEDGHSIQLSGTEKDMSDMIYKNPEIIEEGFKPLSREEHTKYGFIDIFGYDSSNNLTIVECKRQKADLAAVTQLRRYVEKIKKSRGVPSVRGILVAPSISENALLLLRDSGFEFREVKPPKYLERHIKNQTSLFQY